MKNAKLLIIILTLLLTTLLIYYFRIIYEGELIFTHFFYIPIIISAFWWQYNVIYVIIYLIAVLLVSDYYINNSALMMHDFARSSFFFMVGLCVAYLKSESLKYTYLKRYRYIISSMQEPVAIISRDFNIMLKNEKFAEVFPLDGNGFESFRNLLNDEYVYLKFRESIDKCFNNEMVLFSSYVSTSDGSARFFEINLYPLKEKGAVIDIVLSFWDMTEHKNSSIRQSIAAERQKVVIDVLKILNRQNPYTDVIEDILNLIKNNTGIEVLGIILNLDGNFKLHGISGTSADFIDHINSNCLVINNRSAEKNRFCLCGHCLELYNRRQNGEEADEIFWNNNMYEFSENENFELCGCISYGNFQSCAVIPLPGENELLGFFILFDRNRDFFNNEIIDFYRGVVQSIGIALRRINYEISLKKIIADKELLIREVHHRVKNNMQVITSLISLQTARQDDEHVRSILNDCQNRVRTMALVHEKLYNSNNFSSINFHNYIQTLVPMLMNSYRVDRQKIRVGIDVSDVTLSLGTAIPLAQLINELLSNSFKHAFIDGRSGSVSIALSSTDNSTDYSLSVVDDGIGFPPHISFPDKGNLGFQLIDALAKQLRGKSSLSADGGVSYTIYFSES